MGLISVDLPVSGLEPDAEQCAMLELLAHQAELTIAATRRIAVTEHNERIFRRAFESAPSPEIVIDPQLRLTCHNDRFEREFGEVPDVATVDRCIRPEDGGPTLEAAIAPLFAPGATRGGVTVVASREREDGTVWYQVRAHAVVDPMGRRYRAVCSFVDITAERLAQAHHEHAAAHDPLTGLLNRRGGPPAVEALVEASGARGVLAVLACDLDGFKQLNDDFGHGFGDDALVEVAARLRTVVGDRGVVMRHGGDEFVVVAVCEDAPGAAELAATVVGAFGEPVRVGSVVLDVSMSVGAALAELGGRVFVDRLVTSADEALLRAKRAGKDRWEMAGA